MNNDCFKEIITNLVDKFDMSDLELYRINFKNMQSMMELFFDNYYRKVEDITCACDKSRYTVKQILKYLETGEDVKLQETYEDYALRGGTVQSFCDLKCMCYWCPKSIKMSSEALEILFHYLNMNTKFFEERLKSGKYE